MRAEPGKWWNAVCDTLGKPKSDHQAAFEKIAAVGLSGQMRPCRRGQNNNPYVRRSYGWTSAQTTGGGNQKLLSEDEIKDRA